MNLGQNIKSLREQKGLLQKQVATEVGLGISHYNKIENGQREASVEMLDNDRITLLKTVACWSSIEACVLVRVLVRNIHSMGPSFSIVDAIF